MDPNNPDVNQRLPSFKGPRDLTLSSGRLPVGLGPSSRGRRTFVPNIPAKRDKNDKSGPSDKKSSEPRAGPSSDRRGDRDRGDGRGRGARGRKKVEYVQVEGAIFADGIGETKATSRYRAPTIGGSRSSSGVSGGVTRRSVMNSSELMDTINNKSLKNIIGNGKSFIADLPQSDVDGLSGTVHLPLSSCLSRLNVNQVKEDEDAMMRPRKKKAERITFAQTMSSLPPDGTIILLQLPENLPVFHTPPDDKEGTKKELAKSLSTLPEGLVASFELLSTGESRIVMGDAQFELVAGTRPGFLQELILDDDEKFTSLGPVQYKYVGIPNVDSLLDPNLQSDT